jgi:hypothetical protein
MARIGFAVAGLFGLAGLALMIMGYSSTPSAAQSMSFIAGAVLLGASGIALTIAGAIAPPPAARPAHDAGRTTAPSYPDPFASPAAPLATAAATAAAGAAIIASVDKPAAPDFSSAPVPEPAPELDPVFEAPAMPAAPLRDPLKDFAATREPPAAPAADPFAGFGRALPDLPKFPDPIAPARSEPVFELPAFRPRATPDPLPAEAAEAAEAVASPEAPMAAEAPAVIVPPLAAPVSPAITATSAALEETEIEIEAVIEPALEAAKPSSDAASPVTEVKTPAAEEPADMFDLEAAIAAELGIGSPSDAPKPTETGPAEAEIAEEPAIPDAGDMAVEPIRPAAETDNIDDIFSPSVEGAETIDAGLQQSEAETAEDQAEQQMPSEEAPPVAPKEIVGSYESGGVLYTLYDDGSVTAEAGGVIETYASLDDLRAAFDNNPA